MNQAFKHPLQRVPTSSQGLLAWSRQLLPAYHAGAYPHQWSHLFSYTVGFHKDCFFFLPKAVSVKKKSPASLTLNKTRLISHHFTSKVPWGRVGFVPWVSWSQAISTLVNRVDGQHRFACWIQFYFDKLLNFMPNAARLTPFSIQNRWATSTLLMNAS